MPSIHYNYNKFIFHKQKDGGLLLTRGNVQQYTNIQIHHHGNIPSIKSCLIYISSPAVLRLVAGPPRERGIGGTAGGCVNDKGENIEQN